MSWEHRSAKELFNTTIASRTLKMSGAAASCSEKNVLKTSADIEPVKGGCIDHIAVVSARMKGWKTRTFTETVSMHHRTMGTAQSGGLKAKFKYGAKDYSVGNHPRLGIVSSGLPNETATFSASGGWLWRPAISGR